MGLTLFSVLELSVSFKKKNLIPTDIGLSAAPITFEENNIFRLTNKIQHHAKRNNCPFSNYWHFCTN